MESANSDSRVQAVLLSQLWLYEKESCKGRTKTDRVLAAAKANALRDLATVTGLDINTWAFYQRMNQAVEEAG